MDLNSSYRCSFPNALVCLTSVYNAYLLHSGVCLAPLVKHLLRHFPQIDVGIAYSLPFIYKRPALGVLKSC
jgi:hypothetical protein